MHNMADWQGKDGMLLENAPFSDSIGMAREPFEVGLYIKYTAFAFQCVQILTEVSREKDFTTECLQ